MLLDQGILLDLDPLHNITGNGFSQSETVIVRFTDTALTSLRNGLHKVERAENLVGINLAFVDCERLAIVREESSLAARRLRHARYVHVDREI